MNFGLVSALLEALKANWSIAVDAIAFSIACCATSWGWARSMRSNMPGEMPPLSSCAIEHRGVRTKNRNRMFLIVNLSLLINHRVGLFCSFMSLPQPIVKRRLPIAYQWDELEVAAATLVEFLFSLFHHLGVGKQVIAR